MRAFALAIVLCFATACSPAATSDNAASGCARSATHRVAFTGADASDVVTARSEGPTCGQAIVILTARNAHGDPLLQFASTYYDMTAGDTPPQGQRNATSADVDRFLNGWANVSMMRTGDLPEWREGAAQPTGPSFSYRTNLPRDSYEHIRSLNAALLCYASAAEGSRCIIIDPATGGPTEMVAYGP